MSLMYACILIIILIMIFVLVLEPKCDPYFKGLPTACGFVAIILLGYGAYLYKSECRSRDYDIKMKKIELEMKKLEIRQKDLQKDKLGV